nr:hypothetical protein Iba_scaffold50773CG0010 [Ipomoea batatas]GMD91706.1 hypothetical protein Iba_chr14eCG1990 [Ipomoea batatas]
MAGGRAGGAIDNLEGVFEDGRKRERVIETVILNFAVNGGVTTCETLRRGSTAVGVDSTMGGVERAKPLAGNSAKMRSLFGLAG